jgi:hypothetical protein
MSSDDSQRPVSLTGVFTELRAGQQAGLYEGYAIGGAVAAIFYLEPFATEDIDIFVSLSPREGALLISLEPIYAFFRQRGASVIGERLEIAGWQVQLLPSPGPLEEDAVQNAIEVDVDGISVPVASEHHLAAIALQTNRLKDKLRLQMFLGSPTFDHAAFLALVSRFELQSAWSRAQQFFKENS